MSQKLDPRILEVDGATLAVTYDREGEGGQSDGEGEGGQSDGESERDGRRPLEGIEQLGLQLGILLETERAVIHGQTVLGEGNFAVVVCGTYRFPHQMVPKDVAVKIFRTWQNAEESMCGKIKEEVKLGIKLRHPNLVCLFGVLIDASHGPCLVLELCKGGSLRSVLRRAHDGYITLPWRTRVKWLTEIACGVNALHSMPKSIIHRDLTAANVLLSSEDPDTAVAKVADFGLSMTLEKSLSSSSSARGDTAVAKVADFGLSMTLGKSLSSSSSARGGAGTLAWNAPETFQGTYSEKSDAYSFSMVTYETLTFMVPHAGKNDEEIARMATEKFQVQTYLLVRGFTAEEQEAKWLEENPLKNRRPDLDPVQPDCPELLLSLMKTCWADSPDKRPSFRQIVDDLETLQYPNGPCIEGFFSKIEPDKNLLKRLRNAGASDMDELLDTVELVDPHNEAQKIQNVLTRFTTFKINPKPTFQDFQNSMSDAHLRNVRIVHLSGHFLRGFCWLKEGGAEYDLRSPDEIAEIVKSLRQRQLNWAGVEGTIECVVLNAANTEGWGQKLRDIGVSHVVCWRSEVQDTTATQFALNFYKYLDKIHPGNNRPIWNYKQAFHEACAGMDSRMDSGGDAARGAGTGSASVTVHGSRMGMTPDSPHLHPRAIDYVCLLSKDGDEFPKTGHVVGIQTRMDSGGGPR
jgi:serine/threonine protein kinase